MKLESESLNSVRMLEWLETNGLGGFASSTVIGMNTRRYHGLLVAATKPPVGRVMLLSKLEETILVNGERFDLSVNRYPGVVHPSGHRFLEEFRQDPFPRFRYRAGDVQLEKRLFLVHGENTLVVKYEQLSGPACELELRPLIAFRDYHSTTHRNGALNPDLEFETGQVSVQPYPDLPRLHFAHNAGESARTGNWYNDFEYDVESERGLDYREDLFQPFLLCAAMEAGKVAAVIASTRPHDIENVTRLEASEYERRARLKALAPVKNPLVERLTAAADQFIVKRGDFRTITAGYHWFSDWGRDTMIALPGLTLVTGRFEIARDILLAFAKCTDHGMLPNRFPDAGDAPEYNTADATLWFFEAARAYAAYTGDYDFVLKNLFPVMVDILDWHLKGTRYGIHCDEDGLLACGESGVQVTWMDAKIGDWVVTPRAGKPVEIQALWFNALCTMAEFCQRAGDCGRAARCQSLAQLAKKSFEEQFWNSEAGCLCDVVTSAGVCDRSIRPNQILAVSLHFPLVQGDRARQVVELVRRELLTPMGLRTLAVNDPSYKGRYEGGVLERDSAYHQGTVWPWLMGPFITAFCHTRPDGEPARAQAWNWLSAMTSHLDDACLGQISEIADGDEPHRPRGCAAQAWSVAELLRCAVEDVFCGDPQKAK